MKYRLVVICILFKSIFVFSQETPDNALLNQLEAATSDTARIRLMTEWSASQVNTYPDLARQYAEKSLTLSLKTGNKKGEARSYSTLGILYFNKVSYAEAMDLYLKALRIYTELDDTRFIALMYGNIGLLNMKQGNLHEAQENLEYAIELKKKINTTKGVANMYLSLASVFYGQGNMDQALVSFKKGGEYAQNQKDSRIQAACLNGAAAIQFKQKNYAGAIEGYTEAIELFEKLDGDNRKALSGLYHNLASTYREQKNFDKAIELLNRSLKLAEEIQSKEDIKQAYAGLKEYYKDKGDFEKALLAEEQYTVYNDSVVKEQNTKVVNELQEHYKAEVRQKEIHHLQEANVQLEEKSTLRYSLLIVSLGAFLLILLVVFFYLKHLKARQQRKQKELEQKALRAQMNPHFIFNSLNSIQRMYIEGNEDLANDYMADFSRLLRNILENSGKDVIRLKEELDVINLYMELEMLRTNHSFDYACDVADDIDSLQVRIPPLIFQPYLENAIWHGIISKKDKGKIHLSIRKAEPGKLICQVTDNGVGFYSGKQSKPETGNESKGMQITAERLGGTHHVAIEELSTGGTRITLTIHYTL